MASWPPGTSLSPAHRRWRRPPRCSGPASPLWAAASRAAGYAVLPGRVPGHSPGQYPSSGSERPRFTPDLGRGQSRGVIPALVDCYGPSLPNTGGGQLVSRANDLAQIICLWAALCAVAVGLARRNPRRQGAYGRAAPAWRAVGSCLRPGRWASRPGVYQKRCAAPPSGHPAMTVSPETRGQSPAFAVWRCCGQRPGLAGLRRQRAPA